MDLVYKRAGLSDIDLLTQTRLQVLRAANGLDESADLRDVEKEARAYYLKSLKSGDHVAYLVLDGPNFVGAGGVSFYQVMPTCVNPSGRKAYIMNIYTHPGYRRRGIAYHVLDLLVTEAHERGVFSISLETTDMGRSVYEKYGFVRSEREMALPVEVSPRRGL